MRGQQELCTILAATARDLLAETSTKQTVRRSVELAAEHVGIELCASVALVRRSGIESVAGTSKRARRADELQFEFGEGPCLDAIRQHRTSEVSDVAADRHYLDWSPHVVQETGIRSSLCLELFTETATLGALNLYSTHPHGFDDQARAEATVFAALTAGALRSAQIREGLLLSAEARGQIGEAVGMLIERHDISAEESFEMLKRASQLSNRKVHDIARQLVTSGMFPE